MKKGSSSTATASASAPEQALISSPDNGQGGVVAEPAPIDLALILTSLRRMKDGDFSIRLPDSWGGLPGKVADTFNDIVAANEQMARELKRVGHAVGKEGRIRERTRFRALKGAWGCHVPAGSYPEG